MTFSRLTDRVQLTSDSSTRTQKVDRFIIHHAATTSLDVILELFKGSQGRTVSANYALGSTGELVGCVDEDRRAWTSSSSHWDGRAVTIEVANSRVGDPWPVSDAAFHKLARLIADVATRYGFPINDDTVLTHQELWIRYRASYATSCPGDLQRRKPELLALARQYQTPTPTPPQKRRKESKMQLAHIPHAHGLYKHQFLLFGERFFLPFTGQAAAEKFAEQVGPSAPVTQSFFDQVKAQQGISVPVEVVNLDEFDDDEPPAAP